VAGGAAGTARRYALGARRSMRKIKHASDGEEFFDGRLEFAVRNKFLRQQAPAACIGFERARAAAKLCGESSVLRITRASIRVNIDRAGLGKRFDAREAIVGKKNSTILTGRECAQAVAARSVVGGDFRVRRKSINRRSKGGADRLRHFGWNGYDANGQHDLFLTSFF